MIEMHIDRRQQKRLLDAIGGLEKKLQREMKTAVNKTLRKSKSVVSKKVRNELVIKDRDVKKNIRTHTIGTGNQFRGVMTLKKTDRLSLKRFKPRQKRKGVSYRVSKTEGRKTNPRAFMGPDRFRTSVRLGGHVFQRVGKTRLPIKKLMGPSIWGVFVKQRFRKPTELELKADLRKQVEDRIRLNILRRKGLVPGRR